VDTDKVTHLKTYNDKWGLVLEVKLSRLTEAQRKLLTKRVGDAVYRLSQKLAHLSVILLVLNSKPLDQDVMRQYKEQWND
jgi:hypothetical protein